MYDNDKDKNFRNDMTEFLQKQREIRANNPVLNTEQIAGANAAKAEIAEKQGKCPLIPVETQNSVIKKHMLDASKGMKLTPDMMSAFSNIALGR
jgi:hypothetical protein|tara:strand:- start:41 stop:322 length:282 start_codon:yes stop_codon:yes gene_type:complete